MSLETIHAAHAARHAVYALDNLIRAAVDAAEEIIRTTPIVGEGATVYLYTDAHACTVLRVSPSGKTAVLQRDTATLVNGFASGAPDALTFEAGGFVGHTYGDPRYMYAPNPDGEIMTARLTKRGWIAAGRRVRFGRRAEHYDFNF